MEFPVDEVRPEPSRECDRPDERVARTVSDPLRGVGPTWWVEMDQRTGPVTGKVRVGHGGVPGETGESLEVRAWLSEDGVPGGEYPVSGGRSPEGGEHPVSGGRSPGVVEHPVSGGRSPGG